MKMIFYLIIKIFYCCVVLLSILTPCEVWLSWDHSLQSSQRIIEKYKGFTEDMMTLKNNNELLRITL